MSDGELPTGDDYTRLQARMDQADKAYIDLVLMAYGAWLRALKGTPDVTPEEAMRIVLCIVETRERISAEWKMRAAFGGGAT